jgi:hypothetical protein
MDWRNAFQDVVQRYSGQPGGAAAAPANPHEDYQQVARAAPPDAVAGGISQAFRSDQTPPFPEMLANLFSHSDPNQRAGILNRLLAALGPEAAAAIPGLAGQNVTPDQTRQVTPSQEQQLAVDAERRNPSIVDQVSSFYSQHPQVVKALGGLALTIALQHMMRR